MFSLGSFLLFAYLVTGIVVLCSSVLFPVLRFQFALHILSGSMVLSMVLVSIFEVLVIGNSAAGVLNGWDLVFRFIVMVFFFLVQSRFLVSPVLHS